MSPYSGKPCSHSIKPPRTTGSRLPLDTPQRMRDQAKLTTLDHAAQQMVARHDESAASAGLEECPCSFCRQVRPWVTP